MIFLPIETSGEGEINAHSRVQMALGEAKVKAKAEFEQCLKSTGKTLDEDPGVHRGASRTEAAVLSRAASRRSRGHGGAFRPARQRPHRSRDTAVLEAVSRSSAGSAASIPADSPSG